MTYILWRVSIDAFSPIMGGVLGGLLILSLMHKGQRHTMKELFDSFHVGVGYALAVGAACAAVGIVVGVINTTGVAFRLGFMVTTGARDLAEVFYGVIGWIPLDIFAQASIQQFLSLVFIAIACILMGAGLPTTALYIMLVSVAQPALAQLGVAALATHMFVLSTTGSFRRSRRRSAHRLTRPPASPAPTRSRPASPPSPSVSASSWCQWSSSTRRPC